jgi:hypothetical protein
MAGFNLEPGAFRCTTDEFGAQLAQAGIPGIGTGRYYCLPEACTFLHERSRNKLYPYSIPPASRSYEYVGSCPEANAFLDTFLRWSTFCEKYQPEHCQQVAAMVREVAEPNRA